MGELLQVMECVQNLRKGSNCPANQNLRGVCTLLLVSVHLPAVSRKAVAEVLYSSCSATFLGMNHSMDMTGLVWKRSKLS